MTVQINCIDVTEELESQLADLVDQYESHCHDGFGWKYDQIVYTPKQSHQSFNTGLIIYSPLIRYHLNDKLRCLDHGCVLTQSYWMNKRRAGRQPRLLYHVDKTVLLVAQYYTCCGSSPTSRHRIIATSPMITEQLSSDMRKQNLFRLHHRGGWTSELARWVVAHVSNGYSFTSIIELLHQLAVEGYSGDLLRYQVPSEDFLELIFLESITPNIPLYNHAMTQISAISLSLDHTFRISKNVGFKRSSDGKWITQYKCVFIVLNEKGQVMRWKFTPGEAFEHIKPLLVEIRESLANKTCTLSHIIVDNCCKLRSCLQDVFGPTPIKLDVFHAIQRVTKTMHRLKSRNPHCIEELRYIFRQCGDSGKERKSDTVAPSEIITNIDSYISRWNTELSAESIQQLEQLKMHADRGCLSFIPVSSGTNRNENLHRLLNRTMLTSASTLGPELALALLSLFFYKHNRHRDGVKYTKLLLAKESDSNTHDSTTNNTNQGNVSIDTHDTQNGLDAHFLDNICNRVKLVISSIKSVASDTGAPASRIISGLYHFLLASASDKTNLAKKYPNSSILPSIVNKYGRRIVTVTGDGDCAFTSILACLREVTSYSDVDECFMVHLNSLGLINTADSSRNVMTLRKLFVQHITVQENMQKYWERTTLTQAAFINKAYEFLNFGTFAHELGDFVMEVMADVLQCPVTIITAIPGMSTIPLIPSTTISSRTLYVAYDHANAGHYDATERDKPAEDALPTLPMEHVQPTLEHIRISCRCGVNEKQSSKSHCINSADRGYSTRCKCFKNGLKCTKLCSCKRCANTASAPEKQPVTEQIQLKACRKRDQHSHYSRVNSEQYVASMTSENNLVPGPWTVEESVLLQTILQVVKGSRFRNCSTSEVHDSYNRLVLLNRADESTCGVASNSLRSKSLGQIRAKLNFYSYK